MKKIYCLLVAYLLVHVAALANTFVVQVSNFQFNPANIPNVMVGDVVQFHFIAGFHNATSQGVTDAVPGGAAEINSGSPTSGDRTYDYQVTAPGTYKYICEVHADPTTFTGMVGTFTASSPLPITLNMFKMLSTGNNKPLLKWSTLSEENASHFSIRASYDGFKYTEVGKVPATGSSSTEQFYSFTDNNVLAKYKYVYYTLAMVDKDGREKISSVLVFKNTASGPRLVTQIGPNPIKRPGQLMIQFNAEQTGFMAARVYDASGKLVTDTKMSASPGLNNGHLHVCDFLPGVYTIQFAMNGLKETKKIVVQ